MTVTSSFGLETTWNRPGTPLSALTPRAMSPDDAPRDVPVETAARMLYTLGRPTRADRMRSAPRGVRTSKVDPPSERESGPGVTSADRLIAYVTGRPPASDSATPRGSSRLITPGALGGSISK